MGYCFMSMEKIKTGADFTRKYEHNYRTEYVPNADKSKAHLNEELVSLNGKTYLEIFKEKKDLLEKNNSSRKIRKDATKAFEVVTTFSREDAEHINLDEWKASNVKWLQETFNKAPAEYGDNVISVVYHGDENGNVHCHALIVPIDEKGHLNASFWNKGRQKMIELQTSYAKAMEVHGLKRGLQNSCATHKDIKRYYAELNAEVQKELPKPLENESLEDYSKRVNEFYKTTNAVHLREVNKLKREIDEIKTHQKQRSMEEIIEYKTAAKELKKQTKEYLELERMYGSVNIISQMLYKTQLLNDALKNFPDQEYKQTIRTGMGIMMDLEEQRREKLKKEQRQKQKLERTLNRKKSKDNKNELK